MAKDTQKKSIPADKFYSQYTPECTAEDMICCIINGDKEGASSALNYLKTKGEGESEDEGKDKKPTKK